MASFTVRIDPSIKRNRKQISCVINTLYSLKTRNEYCKNDFIPAMGEKNFAKLQDIYSNAITKLTQEKKACPIGYRYKGEFYVKKPYTTPIQYEKIIGSAFMREDLISWYIETDERYKYSYFRTIYRDTSGQKNSEITREEAIPVYEAESA